MQVVWVDTLHIYLYQSDEKFNGVYKDVKEKANWWCEWTVVTRKT